MRLPIAVKSTDINIHGLSIHLHHTAAGIKSSNFGILAPHDRRRERERCAAPEKIESIRRPPPSHPAAECI